MFTDYAPKLTSFETKWIDGISAKYKIKSKTEKLVIAGLSKSLSYCELHQTFIPQYMLDSDSKLIQKAIRSLRRKGVLDNGIEPSLNNMSDYDDYLDCKLAHYYS